jgi:hypothetical protein
VSYKNWAVANRDTVGRTLSNAVFKFTCTSLSDSHIFASASEPQPLPRASNHVPGRSERQPSQPVSSSLWGRAPPSTLQIKTQEAPEGQSRPSAANKAADPSGERRQRTLPPAWPTAGRKMLFIMLTPATSVRRDMDSLTKWGLIFKWNLLLFKPTETLLFFENLSRLSSELILK